MVKKKVFLFALFLAALFGLLTYQSIKGEDRLIDFPLYPLRLIQKGTTALVRGAENLIHKYILIVGKEEENLTLKRKIDGFDQEINQYIEASLENQRLRDILKLKTERPDYVASAEVFARDPTNWFQALWIDKGVKDGIARDMVAVTPAGPVGRVHQVFDEGASLLLITDVNSSVAVRLQSSRSEGILEGTGERRCYLKYIAKDIDVAIGERVITSGLDGIYPEGLLIGHVSDIDREGGEIFQQVSVVPAQDLSEVEELAILKR